MFNYNSYEDDRYEEFNYVNTPRSVTPSTSGHTSLVTANNSGYSSEAEIVLNKKKNKRVHCDNSNETNHTQKIYHSKINSPINNKKKGYYRSSKKIKYPKTEPYQLRPRTSKPKKLSKSPRSFKSSGTSSKTSSGTASKTTSLSSSLESPLSTTFGSSLSLSTT